MRILNTNSRHIYFLVESESNLLKIPLAEVDYVLNHNEVTVFVAGNSKRRCGETLKAVSAVLPLHFVRVSRNCIVNMFKVMELIKKERLLILLNKDRIQVSHRMLPQVVTALREYSVNADSADRKHSSGFSLH